MVLAPRAEGETTVTSVRMQGAPSSWMMSPFLKSDVVSIYELLLFYCLYRLYHNWSHGDVLEYRILPFLRCSDHFVDDIHSLDHLAEYRITEATRSLVPVVEEVVVHDVDEELRCCRVNNTCPCHCQGPPVVFQAIAGLVLDWGLVVRLGL